MGDHGEAIIVDESGAAVVCGGSAGGMVLSASVRGVVGVFWLVQLSVDLDTVRRGVRGGYRITL